MLTDKVLIYDDHCPLCTWYSGLFIKYKFLPHQGRQPFSKLATDQLNQIDFEKGKDEIPLLDIKTGKVYYGIDSLLIILNEKLPILSRLGHVKPVYWCLKKFYKLISYNRKVIVAKKCGTGDIDCSPHFDYFYRVLFMGIFLLFNTIMLSILYNSVFSNLSFFTLNGDHLQLAHFGLIGINCSLAFTLKPRKAIEYLGQVNMLATISILLLLPLILVREFFFNEIFISLYLMISTIIVFKEYIRRMDYAGLLLKNRSIVSLNLVSIMGFLFLIFN